MEAFDESESDLQPTYRITHIEVSNEAEEIPECCAEHGDAFPVS